MSSYPALLGPLFISDLHLFDVTSMSWRPNFSDVYSYADFLIESWNRFTCEDSVVFIVGDVGHYCNKTIEVLNKCNGKKLLILGNHDTSWGNEVYTCGAFLSVYPRLLLDTVYINHIPEYTDVKYNWYIHGHHHRYDMPGMYNALQLYAKDTFRLNCSADINNHRPCNIQELLLNKEVMVDKLRESGLLKED